MSDPTDAEQSSERPESRSADSAGDAPRRPNPGAQAASRARRIGGRPMPGPRPGGTDDTAAAGQPVKSADKPARSSKPDLTKPRTAAKPTAPRQRARRRPAVEDAASTQRRLATVATALALVATVAIVALLGVGLWLSHGVWWAKSSTDAKRMTERQQVLAAAKTCTARVLSYDYRALADAEKAGQACSTGQLKSDYTRLMDTTVKQIAPQNNVVQVFQVEKAGVSRVSPDGKQWVIVVFGQQQVSSKTVTSGPRLDISNAVVTMNKVGGTWLISNMTTAS